MYWPEAEAERARLKGYVFCVVCAHAHMHACPFGEGIMNDVFRISLRPRLF